MGTRGKRNQIIYRDTPIINNTAGMKELAQLTRYESTLLIEMDINLQWSLYMVVDKIKGVREIKDMFNDLLDDINLIS